MNFSKLTGIPMALAFAAMLAIPAAGATPPGTPIYNNIPSTNPPNVPSEGFQCCQKSEFGNHIQFAGTSRKLSTVTVLMSDWAKHSDYPSMPTVGWTHPITLNLYSVATDTLGHPKPGSLIASKSQTFLIPWRPDTDPACGGDDAWKASDGNCYHGYAFTIIFDLSSMGLTLPNEIIYGIAYNTNTWGYNPLGVGGPYESLNVGLTHNTPPAVGTDPEPGVLFVYGNVASGYADGGVGGVQVFRRDVGWNSPTDFYSPAVQFNTVAPSMGFAPSTTTFCAAGDTVKVNLSDVVNLYGYQFEVHYNPSIATASGAFDNSFVDTVNSAYIPGGWNATCDNSTGVCKFAVTKGPPALPVSFSGPVAQLTFTAVKNGEFDVTMTSDKLSDKDGMPIAHDAATPTHLKVSCLAQVSGVVTLQGRATPIDAGQVKLTEGTTVWNTTDFNATSGAYSFTDVPVLPGGTTYTFDASHLLYVGNQMTYLLKPGESYVAPTTKLWGGDSNNDGNIGLPDLICIGSDFGTNSNTCPGGSSDINHDGSINIFDLVLAGGNYDKNTPQPWQ